VRSAPCTRRRGARVSWLNRKTTVGGFSGLGLKTGSCSLVIWASKSQRRILCLDLKTKRAMVCWLRHKIDGRRTARDTHQNIVRLGFPNLPQNWRMSDDGWCTWHHHGGHVKMKSKTDRSMRQAASDPFTPTFPFS
jgi:hypothetical protein